ncbi:3-methyladenine DNA glycosylase [Leucobacter sp. UT-8R-CII-1-4]|uniref:3-methyladenine DNA glycosylase n=1 Tax=Leucobacter sp. UT-8R-CII-1-4 TaxID=3040075 RepID=UPI0024A950A2|nr:3-methyladenine DNA glycosylase [Leucobacter sp. UT-8R-CII-1-4]MDI6023561.1 3-methyladenine DNA glycosylase [Leucobacter sp. UT-8R-CII-1-4]
MTLEAGEQVSLPHEIWQPIEAAHQRRVEELTTAHLARRLARQRHPVEDFLWTYYSVKPAELRRWHPGAGITLEVTDEDRVAWKFYTVRAGEATVDLDSYFEKRGATVDYVEQLLGATLEHTPQFGCFGLHEWAMVYRMTPEQLRHTGLPLRIGHEATDQVVETNPISCTHFDAYRFFTPEAAPLNALRPTRESQPALEQSGCLHAGMDVYKWAAKLGPIIPGDVLLDAFVLARDIREVDMRASPYDVSEYRGADGELLSAVPIETAAGKRQYAELQRGFAERGNALRHRVLAAIAHARLLRQSQ